MDMTSKNMELIVPKINLLSSVTTLSRAADTAMNFSSSRNNDVLKKIQKKMLQEEISRKK
jgi:hypothetical protein